MTNNDFDNSDKDRIVDVLIVGAGPAGSSAAYALAKHGLKALVVDKHEFPREKLCGNFVSGMCQKAIGFDLPKEIIRGQVTSSTVQYTHRATVEFPGPAGVFVSRKQLDNFLLEKAIAGGAEFRPNRRVVKIADSRDGVLTTTLSDGDTIQSRFVIGGDGCRGYSSSYVRGETFRKWQYAIAYAVEIPRERVTAEIAEDLCMDVSFMPGGYAWIFNEGDTVNIGAGSSMLFNKRVREHFQAFLKRYLNDDELLNSLKIRGKLLPIGGLPRTFTKGSVFLVGDAAGAVDAVSGEGIGFAVRSGRMAADAIAANRESSRAAGKAYKRSFKQGISRELRPVLFYAGLLFIFRPLFFSLVPRFSRILFSLQGEAIAGDITHRQFIFKALRLLPGLLVKNIWSKVWANLTRCQARFSRF